MIQALVLSVLVAVTIADGGPMRECEPGDMFIADIEDCCRYWWCVEGHEVRDYLCAPGSRVPTWWMGSADYHNPCVIDNRQEDSCLRCDLDDDPRLPEDDDNCAVNPCDSGCTCQDLFQAYYCMCPGVVYPPVITVDPEENFCPEPNSCVNGGTCYSQWDDYWCMCPKGFTGKNCENDYCQPNPCQNGGTCVYDETNYHCICPPGTTGPCCDGGQPRTEPVTIPPTTTATKAPIIDCEPCFTGADCSIVLENSCSCFPCPNYDDDCFDGENGEIRKCVTRDDLSGTPFTLAFIHNRDDNTEDRELEIYVTAAGEQAREVRVYSPYIDTSNRCYFSETFNVPGLTVRQFRVPNPECFEQENSKQFDDKLIKVESIDGRDLSVYAVNRDQYSADAWVAFPDTRARIGEVYYIMCYGPPQYATEFSFLGLEDETTVKIEYQPGATPDMSQTSYTLSLGESVQIQSQGGDLTGTMVTSDKRIHVYSGNIRALITQNVDPTTPQIVSRSRDHLVEQSTPVSAWDREYHVVPIPNRAFGDHIRVLASEANTQVTVEDRDGSGKVSEQTFTLMAGKYEAFDAFSNHTYRITANNKIFVGQFVKSKNLTEASNDPSLIFIPPVAQYSNRYILSTPEFSGGAGAARPYNTSLALISARGKDRNDIYVRNKSTGDRYSVSSRTSFGDWHQIPGTDYYGKAVEIDYGTNTIEHPDQTVEFMCLYYGMDDRESLGFPIGMMLRDLP